MEQLSYPERVKRQIAEAKDEEKLLEDIEHLYFCGVGILTCALSNWQAAAIAAVATVIVRQGLRTLERRKRFK